MTIVRRFLILALAAALVGLGMLAWLRPGAHTGWPLWPLHLAAGIATYTSVFSDQRAGRRLLLTLALLLSFGVVEVQSLHLLMSHEDWLAADMPTKPGPVQAEQLLRNQLEGIVRFAWVQGLSAMPLMVALPAMVLAAVTLINQGFQPVLPSAIRRLANIGAGIWLLVLCLFIGRWVLADSGVPRLVLVMGVLLLPWGLGNTSKWTVGPLWGACVAAALAMAADWIWDAGRLLDLLCAIGIMTTLICWLVWYWFMNDIVERDLSQPKPPPVPDFDLVEHLDSPEAQEGADKYTRE